MQSDADLARGINETTSALYRTFSRPTRPQQALSALYPFKVYQFPMALRNFLPSDAQLRFKVRGGGIGTFPGSSAPTPGTDGSVLPDVQAYLTGTVEIPPNDSTLISSSWHEFIAPQDGNPTEVWLSRCLNTEPLSDGICVGRTNTAAISLQTGNTVNDPWVTFPTSDPYHILLAEITAPQGGPYTVVQHIYDHIVTSRFTTSAGVGVNSESEMYYCGAYDSSAKYFVGDVVQVVLSGMGVGAGGDFLIDFIYRPGIGSAFPIKNGPISGINPMTNSPDPWQVFCGGQLPYKPFP